MTRFLTAVAAIAAMAGILPACVPQPDRPPPPAVAGPGGPTAGHGQAGTAASLQQVGTDPEREILKAYLRTERSRFDPERAAKLETLRPDPRIEAAIRAASPGVDPRTVPLAALVDQARYAAARKPLVADARSAGLIP